MVAVHTDTADTADSSGTSDAAKPRVAAGLWLTAAAFAAVELAVSPRYGFHRDELYFLAAGRHPALGYVDQPPLAPLLTRLATSLFGNSPSAVRVIPALAGGALVLVAGLTARLLGGRAWSQVLTAFAAGCAPVTLVAAHLANTTIYDLLAWSAITALTLAAVNNRPRLWLAVGAVTGISLENKDLPLLLVIALLAGLVATGRWRVLRTPWLPAGAAVALALWAPNLAWQATHGWPALTMSRILSAEHSGFGDYLTVLPAQPVYLGLAAVPLALVGARRLARDPALRFLAVAAGLVLLFVVADIPGRPYYTAGLLPAVFAAGAVTVEARAASQRSPAWLLAPPIGAALGAAIILPILPIAVVGQLPFLHKLNYDLGETIGWPQLTGQVAHVYHALPPGERADASIFTANYAEAGAISLYGPRLGLPTPLSGNNNYFLWGPHSAQDRTVVAVGAEQQLRRYFRACVTVATFRSPHGVDNDENGVTIGTCTGPLEPWRAFWSRLRHYG